MDDSERSKIRELCGYPAYGLGYGNFNNWRFYQAYGQLENRLQRLTGTEETVVRTYLSTLDAIERTPTTTEVEKREYRKMVDAWRHRLCSFIGVPAGPELGSTPPVGSPAPFQASSAAFASDRVA